jgi:hypothetical protein
MVMNEHTRGPTYNMERYRYRKTKPFQPPQERKNANNKCRIENKFFSKKRLLRYPQLSSRIDRTRRHNRISLREMRISIKMERNNNKKRK